jgi:hypothetical protein
MESRSGKSFSHCLLGAKSTNGPAALAAWLAQLCIGVDEFLPHHSLQLFLFSFPKRSSHVPTSYLLQMPQAHLGRLRPAYRASPRRRELTSLFARKMYPFVKNVVCGAPGRFLAVRWCLFVYTWLTCTGSPGRPLHLPSLRSTSLKENILAVCFPCCAPCQARPLESREEAGKLSCLFGCFVSLLSCPLAYFHSCVGL